MIGSGDGIFAHAAAGLYTAGCAVTVVSRAEALSSRLSLAVRDIELLPQTLGPAAIAQRAA